MCSQLDILRSRYSSLWVGWIRVRRLRIGRPWWTCPRSRANIRIMQEITEAKRWRETNGRENGEMMERNKVWDIWRKEMISGGNGVGVRGYESEREMTRGWSSRLQYRRRAKEGGWGEEMWADLADDFVEGAFWDKELFEDVGETVAAGAEDDEEVAFYCVDGAVVLAPTQVSVK